MEKMAYHLEGRRIGGYGIGIYQIEQQGNSVQHFLASSLQLGIIINGNFSTMDNIDASNQVLSTWIQIFIPEIFPSVYFASICLYLEFCTQAKSSCRVDSNESFKTIRRFLARQLGEYFTIQAKSSCRVGILENVLLFAI